MTVQRLRTLLGLVGHRCHYKDNVGVFTGGSRMLAHIWARLVAKLWANHSSPVLNTCRFAVCVSFMMPNSGMDYAS